MSPNLQRNDYVIYTDASYRNDKSGSNAGIAFLIYDFEMKLVDAQCKHVSVSCVQEAEAKAVEFALQNLPADAKRVKVLNDTVCFNLLFRKSFDCDYTFTLFKMYDSTAKHPAQQNHS